MGSSMVHHADVSTNEARPVTLVLDPTMLFLPAVIYKPNSNNSNN